MDAFDARQVKLMDHRDTIADGFPDADPAIDTPRLLFGSFRSFCLCR
jgi:hypothetical protein